jgi:mannose-6-phosphate isomerase-like protein (cupin superfamily)
MSNINDVQRGNRFTAAHAGSLSELDQYTFGVGTNNVAGKLFLKDNIDLTGMEMSVNKMPPGTSVPFSHKHKANEELFFFIKGQGQFLIDGELIEVREGSAVRVAPEGVRAVRNNSTEDLYYIVIQAKDNSLDAYTLTDGEIVDWNVTWPK